MPEIPFAFQWTIPEDQLIALKDSINGALFSKNLLNIAGFEYYLKIYPNGNDDESRGETYIFLKLKLGNVKKVEAEYTTAIETADFAGESKYIFEKSHGWGPCVADTKEFFDHDKKYIVDGKCTIKVDGIFKFESLDANSAVKQQKWEGGEVGAKVWEKDDSKDFIIVTEKDKEIKVQKLILGARSDVFAAMFESNMKESIENKVEIPDFTFNVLETAVKLIYHCQFSTSLSTDEMMSLLQFFEKYNISELKEKVERILIGQISAATVCRLANCSIISNSEDLKNACMEFLKTAFASKTALSDFDILDKDLVFNIIHNSLYQIVEIE